MTEEKIIKTCSPYCKETHKIILGVHEDIDGNEFVYQPERSKREDLDDLDHEWTGIPTTERSWCRKCGEEPHIIKLTRMRCSEHDGNIVRGK